MEGNRTADATTIIANSGLKVGDEIEVPGDKLINAVRRLWNLNIFKDVQILVDQKIDNGIFLLIKIEEFKRFEKFIVRGNDEIDEDDIYEKVTLGRGQVIRPQSIYRSISKVKELYDEEGYLNAEITSLQYQFVKADTSDDEITVTWSNVEDNEDELETNYDYDPDVSSRLVDKLETEYF